MAAPLTHAEFEPHLKKLFRFKGVRPALKLEQIDVRDHEPLPGLGYKAFSLIFSGPRDEVMPEGLYTAEVEGGPSFEFYINPIHTVARDRQDYQAVFN
jgi:hypothetical protein